MSALPPIERLQAVELGPDDILVATLSSPASDAEIVAVQAALRAVLPDRASLVMDDGVRIAVYRPRPVVEMPDVAPAEDSWAVPFAADLNVDPEGS